MVRWGIPNSLKASRFFHACMLGFLAGFGVQAGFSTAYYAGIGLVAAFLLYQHKRIYALEQGENGPRFTLSPAMMAVNGWIAVLYLAVVGVSLWL